MYGYQPPQQDPEGSWSEIFVMSRVVLGILAVPILIIFGVLFLLGSAVWLLGVHPLLSLLPLAVLGAGVWVLVERDKKAQRSLEDEIFSRRRP
ncbi:MAG: hypothetical protein AB7F65_01875 [Dehalococcoidia bacterium]